jgi:hypothetical protein
MQFHQGKLWKCPALAYLGLPPERYGLGPEWAPYLASRPLKPGYADEKLAAFLARAEESCCGLCPAVPQPFALPSPLLRLGRPAARRPGSAGGADPGGRRALSDAYSLWR